MLQLALEEEPNSGASASPVDDEKALTTAFITYHVLAKLGFAKQRIVNCLEATGGGWEEALEWVSYAIFKLTAVMAQFERRRVPLSRRVCATDWYETTIKPF